MAKQQGLTEEQIGDLFIDDESTILTPREKAAVRYTDILAGDHTQASQELFDELHEHFTEQGIIDLGLGITPFLGPGRLIRALGFEKGGVCPLTDQHANGAQA